MDFAHGETVTILRAGSTTDRYSNTVTDWTTPTETVISGCAFAPRTTEEDRGNYRQAVIVGLTMYAPPGSDITAADRVRRANDDVFEIEGMPGEWVSPFTGWQAGIEVALRKVEG